MAAVAAAAVSDAGQLHYMACLDTGADPAAGIPDPLVAANFRVACKVIWGRRQREADPVDEMDYWRRQLA